MKRAKDSIVGALVLCLTGLAHGADAPRDLATGSRLAAKLDAPLTASWLNVELRTLLERVSAERELSLLIDRRIDPNRVCSMEVRGKPLRDALSDLADEAGASVRITHSVVTVAPKEAAGRLRTLIQLRADELGGGAGEGLTLKGSRRGGGAPSPRRFALSARKDVTWDDLDEPREIVRWVAALWRLKTEGLDRIPHDLWAGAMLPDVTAAEALSLVLNQFDLTFEWTNRGEGIRIVPVAENVSLERRYSPRGMKPGEAAARWADEIDGLHAAAEGDEVRVRGTLEQHEAVQELLNPGARTASAPRARKPSIPLKRRTFTLRTKDAPASAVLRTLADSGLTIRYDAARLKDEGIDLDARIALDLDKASVDELFEAIGKPLGLKHRIEGEAVILSSP